MNWFSNFQKNSFNMNNVQNSVIMSGRNGKTIINGVEYDLPPNASISTINGKVYINGEEVTGKHVEKTAEIKIEIHGDVEKADVGCDLRVTGNVSNANAGQDIKVFHGDIKGNATAGMDIKAQAIHGNATAGMGITIK